MPPPNLLDGATPPGAESPRADRPRPVHDYVPFIRLLLRNRGKNAGRNTILIRMQHNTAVIVLGMHRSGTSALAGMLDILGVQFGKSLLPPAVDNPRGFWEHEAIVDLNDRILAALGSSWDDVRPMPDSWWTDERVTPIRAEIVRILRQDFGSVRLWGLKDPRICKLLPLWYDILDQLGCQACFVLIHRHPLEVAQSLKRRDGFDARKSGLLWLEHNLLSEKWTRGRSRIFASYDQVLGQPEAVSVKISKMIGQSAGVPAPHRVDAVRDFLAPGLRHHQSDSGNWGAEFGGYRSLIEKAYHELLTRCRDDTPGEDRDFDRLSQDYKSITSKFDPTLTAHIEDLTRRIGELRENIERITSSKSWKITEPLRGAKRLMFGTGKGAIPK